MRASCGCARAINLPLPSKLPLYVRLLRDEGVGSGLRRILDRFAEARRRRSFELLPRERFAEFLSRPPPVLNYIPCPPAARFGGVALQLTARLEEESRMRPVALLYPLDGRYRLELRDGGRRAAVEFQSAETSPVKMVDARFETVIAQVLGALRINALHLEGAAEVPLESVARLQTSGVRMLMSLHDFSLFCARPALVEHPTMRFCDYSIDLERCCDCLGVTWPEHREIQPDYRKAAARVLGRATAVVFPSEFLRRKYAELFPDVKIARVDVIEPAIELPVDVELRRSRRQGDAVRHVAIVGAVTEPKGSRILEEVITGTISRALRWSVFGGGDSATLRRLRAKGVMTGGYYRAGTLPDLLRHREVDIAVMLSIVPESFSLTLSECWVAGVPVIAFDHGAVADRIRANGGGILVKLSEKSRGIARALETLDRLAIPPLARKTTLPTPEATAAAYGQLYRELGSLSSSAGEGSPSQPASEA